MYKVYGRPFAGSLIGEFLLTEANVDYQFIKIDYETSKKNEFLKKSPMGKIPVLECPDGNIVFETTAIVAHIVETKNILIPKIGTPQRDLYNQLMSVMSTSIYQNYHHQNHSYYYVSEENYDDLRNRAAERQIPVYDYIESILKPYLCGDEITAADFYLYMIATWDNDRKKLFTNRPKLSNLIKELSDRPSIKKVISSHSNKD
jgi:glutathione S-transferase